MMPTPAHRPAHRPGHHSPSVLLLTALATCLLLAALATWQVLREPWLGVQLAAADDPAAPPLLLAAPWPNAAGGQLLALQAGAGAALPLRSDDLREEPDTLDTYPEMAAFFARQSQLHALLGQPLTLHWQDAAGVAQQTALTPAPRPFASLPPVLFFQLLAGTLGCLLGVWVVALRPTDWGARMFAATGLAFPLFTFPAAIYSSRTLALPGELFEALSRFNHFGAAAFGCALAALFLSYPRPLWRSPRQLLWLPASFGLWWLADALRLAPDQDWGSRFLVLLEMLLAILAGIVQWRRARQIPGDRAALRWLLLSSLLGCGLFVLLMAGGPALGWLPPLPQGYAFGFFLIMHGGMALGVYRYRLFDLDRWSYRILLWVGGAAALIALDAALIFLLGLNEELSLGLSLLVCGGLYFPLRQWLWQWLVARPELPLRELLPSLLEIAFDSDPASRSARWQALLCRQFAPLRCLPAAPAAGNALADGGNALTVAPVADLPACRLEHRSGGRQLFTPADVAAVAALAAQLEHALQGRGAYEQGVSEERRRLAEDMHDDIGARLLMLIHRAPDAEQANLARAAMTDLRTAIAALDAAPQRLADALADWRAEIAERCELAGVRLHWHSPPTLPDHELAARPRANLERAIREAVSNAIRHAAPSTLAVTIRWHRTELEIDIANDGQIAPPAEWQPGRGSRTLDKRLRQLGGSCQREIDAAGWLHLRLTLPTVPPAETP